MCVGVCLYVNTCVEICSGIFYIIREIISFFYLQLIIKPIEDDNDDEVFILILYNHKLTTNYWLHS